jgi:nitrite reductase/ring-hydroxylating ferredoxin subunit
VRTLIRDEEDVVLEQFLPAAEAAGNAPSLQPNEFMMASLPPGNIIEVEVEGEAVAVYNVEGQFYAIHNRCTHVGGPLSQGHLDGYNAICPWHDSCFDVRSGEATCGPAKKPVRTYRVQIDNGVGRVAVS